MLFPAVAFAQGVDRHYAEEPTDGLSLPLTPLAGEHDGRAVVMNPGGLTLTRGPEIALALDGEDSSVANSAGPGFGAYLASSVGGGFLPRLGVGMGFEWLRPPRTQLAPDPGTPFRYTLAYAVPLGAAGGFGVSWHHFIGSGPLDGKNTFDLGFSTRWTAYFALGGVVRDLSTGDIGGTPVQRRYSLEAVVRPLATDALEVAVGGQLGETRLDVDGWARLSARAARGVYLLAGIESRELHTLDDSPMGTVQGEGRDLRATLGVELSFGRLGIAALGTGLRDEHGTSHPLGGTFIARASLVGPPSMLGSPEHIERIELEGEITDRALTAQVLRLREIARDRSAKALVVMLDGVSGGWAGLEELRDEILLVKKAGKKVFAYMVAGTSRDYFIACAADRIYIDPAGGVRLVGMAGTTLYFRGAFDLVGVLPEFEKIGEYKSAPEQLTETGPTPMAAKMRAELFDSLWERWVAAVADGRHLSADRVRAIVDAGPYTSGDLDKNKELVDAVAAPDKVSQLVTTELGGIYPVAAPPGDRPDRWERPAIAVIYISGEITDGTSKSFQLLGRELAGGETLVQAIAAARSDPRIGAIVLRIDSPGGSALASELISREVFETRGVKPILCSMSNLAASGGYFAAAGCDLIYAEPMTITGSIGIFSGKFDISHLLGKLGITTDTYKHGQRSDLESMYRPYTDEERALMLEKLGYMYSRFVGAVAEGRQLSKADVDKVGRGHVYTGEQAAPIHLINRFGGLADALDEAKRRMHLPLDEKVTLVELPKVPSNVLEQIGSLLGADTHASPSLLDLPVVRELARGLPASLLVSPDSAQARLPFDISWD